MDSRTIRLAVVGGDGIGPEVTAEALKVLGAAGVSIDETSYDGGVLTMKLTPPQDLHIPIRRFPARVRSGMVLGPVSGPLPDPVSPTRSPSPVR